MGSDELRLIRGHRPRIHGNRAGGRGRCPPEERVPEPERAVVEVVGREVGVFAGTDVVGVGGGEVVVVVGTVVGGGEVVVVLGTVVVVDVVDGGVSAVK